MPRQARPVPCPWRVRPCYPRRLRRRQWHIAVLLLCVFWRRWCVRCTRSHSLVRSKVSRRFSRRSATNFVACRVWRQTLRRLVASILLHRLQGVLSVRLQLWNDRRCRFLRAICRRHFATWQCHLHCRRRNAVPRFNMGCRPLALLHMSRFVYRRLQLVSVRRSGLPLPLLHPLVGVIVASAVRSVLAPSAPAPHGLRWCTGHFRATRRA